jgi:hypothetical protein
MVVLAAPAGAAKFKELGKPARHVGSGGSCGGCNVFQLETAPSTPSYVVPNGDWKIIAWRSHGNKNGIAKARLRIYRPTGVTDQYEIAKESDIKRFPEGKITERSLRMRVEPGDHLGLVGVGDFPTSYDGRSADTTGHPTGCIFPTVGDTVGGGGTCGLTEFASSRANIGVTLKRR